MAINLGRWIKDRSKNVGNVLSKSYDQANPFDAGRSWQTRQPTYKASTGSQLTDIFNQDSPQDKARRYQQLVRDTPIPYRLPSRDDPRVQSYRQQQIASGNKRPFESLGAQLAGNTGRLANTAAYAISQGIETGRGSVAQLTGNDKALSASLDRQRYQRQNAGDTSRGLLGAGTIYNNEEEARNLGNAEIAKRVGLTTLGTASEVLPFARVARPVGIAGKAGMQIARGGKIIAPTTRTGRVLQAASAAERGTSGYLPKVAFNAGLDVTTGAGESIARQYAQTGNIDAGTLLGDVAASTVLGQVPVQVGAAGKGAAQKISKTTNPAYNELLEVRKAAQKAYDVETNPKVKKEINSYLTKLNNEIRKEAGIIPKVRAAGPDDAPLEKPSIVQDFQTQQDLIKNKYKESGGRKVAQSLKRQLVDPRSVEQALDNAEFKRLKKAGKLKKGQKELLPEQSVAAQTGLIENPGEAAEVLNKTKYKVGDSSYSINDIIKEYGNDTAPKAKDFETYRIFKDERWRQENGQPNTLGLDPNAMDEFIRRYEKSNPKAIEHHEALRLASLDALRAKRDARIDSPELFENSAKNPYYTPRRAVNPEELKNVRMTGGVRSGASTTKGRAASSGGPVEAPLSLYLNENNNVVRALAEQRKGMLVREKAKSGVTFKGQQFKEVLDAEKVIEHKKAVKQMKDLWELNKKQKIKIANTRADLRTSKASEYFASRNMRNKVRKNLRQLVGDDTDAAPAISTLTDKELAKVAQNLTDNQTKGLFSVTKTFSKKSEAHAKLALQLEEAKAFSEGISEAAKDAGTDAVETMQNFDRGTQTYSYRLDGETGKIEIPASYAAELDAANKARAKGLIEKGITPIASTQKLFWTGVAAPVFKAYNVLIKNPIIAYRNADSLSGVGPNAWRATAEQLINTDNMKVFKQEMKKRGISYQNAFETKRVVTDGAADIAARKDFNTFISRNPVKTLKDLWSAIDQTLAFPDNVQRTSVAYGAYKRAKRLDWSEEKALQAGASAPAKVFGDFSRISRLAQDAEILVPYSGAIQSGARALGRATKTKPIQTTVKDAALVSLIVGTTAYGMKVSGDDEGNDYYTDMINSDKEYLLDNNTTWVTPWAKRNEDGSWDGVIHVPISPDLRPIVKATWRTTYDNAHGQGTDPSLIAGEMFDLFTGDVKDSLYDTGSSAEGERPLNAVLAGSPMVSGGKIVAGINPRTGEPLADEAMARKDRTEQFTDYTSETAKKASKWMKGILTPQQIDKYLDTTGFAGDILQNREEGGTRATFTEGFKKPFKPGEGVTEKKKAGRANFKDVEDIGKTLKNDDDFRLWQALNSTNTVKTPQDSAARAQSLLASPDVLGGFKEKDKRARDRGETGDPFFDLTPQRQQKVLLYKASKDVNSAKQAYDKNGTPLFISLGLDEKWYSDFKDKESERWEKIFKDNPDAKATNLTFSGAKKPRDPKMEALQTQYHKLDKGTGARSAFLDANPELLEYWAQGNQFTNAERIALGLKVTDEDGNLIYGDSGSGYGSGGGSGGGRGGGKPKVTSPYKYNVSLSSGAFNLRPQISVKSRGAAPVKARKVSAPKVSLKKSQV